MGNIVFDQEVTALLVMDPYNDFISEGGKLWDRVKAVAEANSCVPNMLQVLNTSRQARLRIFYALHHRYRPGDYESWKYIAPVQRAAWEHKTFEEGTWGGTIRNEFLPQAGDVVALEHWCSSGFANTDLDLQLKTPHQPPLLTNTTPHQHNTQQQKARHSSAHRHRANSTHLCGINSPFCC